MGSPDPWPIIHGERRALVADLESLTPEQWTTTSLCTDWIVQQVVGHLTATAMMTPGRFFSKLVGAGFRFNAMTAKDVASESGGTAAETLAGFRAQLGTTTRPPGPIDAMVGEIVIHSEDIRRPLGIRHAYPAEALVRAGDFYLKSNLLIGAKKRAAGITLRATDVDWTRGSGPEVAGPLLSLLLAIVGRQVALPDLSGDGVATLQGRP